MTDSPPAAKKAKLSSDVGNFLESVQRQRLKAGESVEKFNFNKKRVRNLTPDAPEVAKDCPEGVLYWMFRDQRVHDNWGLLYAQKLALKTRLPLHVVFCLRMKFMDATLRQFDFLLKGLEEVAVELKKLDIPFHFLYTDHELHSKTVGDFVKKNKIGCVVVDFSPLKVFTSWTESLKDHLPEGVPLCQVDSHNIVPCWEASDKLEYGARTIRGKITKKLDEYLTEFPAVAKHPHRGKLVAEKVDWDHAYKHLQVDRSVGPVEWAKAGFKGGMQTLFEFTEKRLKNYADKRNNPLMNALSNLSPWLHFGQISAQRCILHVRTFKSKYKESVDAYCEETIIRRELSDNFCFYNKNYDNLAGAYAWAKESLDLHRNDKREYVYTKEEFEKALTHDDLWNSAQIQLSKEGKMHGFLRMYWAKKILEWTTGPEEALSIALYLNDKYSVDGRDPSGFVGCMWSICGVHDQGWREREVFGKIRYMNYKGCERKFDVKAFVARYGGKVHKKGKERLRRQRGTHATVKTGLPPCQDNWKTQEPTLPFSSTLLPFKTMIRGSAFSVVCSSVHLAP